MDRSGGSDARPATWPAPDAVPAVGVGRVGRGAAVAGAGVRRRLVAVVSIAAPAVGTARTGVRPCGSPRSSGAVPIGLALRPDVVGHALHLRSQVSSPASVGLGLEHRCHGTHRLTRRQPGNPHPGGVPTLGRDLLDLHPDDIASRGEHEYLIVGHHGERGHHRTPGSGDLHTPHALAATALAVERLELGALPVAARAHEQHHRAVLDHRRAHHGVLGVLELHAPHAGGGPAHRAHVVLGEADGHAVRRHHDDVVLAVGLDHLHQLVAVLQVDGDQPVAQRGASRTPTSSSS